MPVILPPNMQRVHDKYNKPKVPVLNIVVNNGNNDDNNEVADNSWYGWAVNYLVGGKVNREINWNSPKIFKRISSSWKIRSTFSGYPGI